MAARLLLDMEPQVGAVGGFERQAVILQVVAPAQDGIAVAGTVAQRRERTAPAAMQRLLPAGNGAFQVALLQQLLPNFQQLSFGGGAAQRLLHRFDVGDLLLALGDQAAEHRFGVGGLAVFIIILLHVAAGGKPGVQRNGNGRVGLGGGVILAGECRHALLQAVQVGGKQVAVKAQLLPAGAFFQLLQPDGPFAQQPLVDGIDLPAQPLACQLDPLAAGF